MNGDVLTREPAAAVGAPVLEGEAVATYLLDAIEALGPEQSQIGGSVAMHRGKKVA